MFTKTLHFLKYNNLTIFLILAIFLFAGSVFAQTPTGQEFIGTKKTNITGIDNMLLLEADLDNFAMDFKIEKIEEDEKYYYVTYTYIDLVQKSQAWQYQIQENLRKISKKSRVDVGEYLAEELSEQYEARIKELKREKKIAQTEGEGSRFEVEEYNGLIGQALTVATKVFPDYTPVKKKILPTPSIPPTILKQQELSINNIDSVESIDDIYEEYVENNDPDGDLIFGIVDNCPYDYNPSQEDVDQDDIGDICDDYITPTDETDILADLTPINIATGSDQINATNTPSESKDSSSNDGEGEKIDIENPIIQPEDDNSQAVELNDDNILDETEASDELEKSDESSSETETNNTLEDDKIIENNDDLTVEIIEL